MGKSRQPVAVREPRDIEWLVNWALEKQQAASGARLTALDYPQQLKAANYEALKVDASPYRNDGRHVHGDADIVMEALQAMIADPRTSLAGQLVWRHGLAGSQPDWGEAGIGRWEVRRRLKGGRMVAVKRFSDQRQARGLLGFDWEYVGLTTEDLDRMMIEWLLWRAALVELIGRVNQRMASHLATGPRASAAPWDAVVHTSRTTALAREEEI